MRLLFEVHHDSHEPDALVSPHFEDETTLLSARPVVPLAPLRTKFQRKRIFALLSVAALSGVVGGFILVGLERARNEARHTPQNANNTVTVASADASSDQNKDSAVTNSPETPSADNASAHVEESTRNAEIKKSTNRALADEPETQRRNQRSERRESLHEARRAERRAERMGQRPSQGRTEDIFRIGDIFEGSRRP